MLCGNTLLKYLFYVRRHACWVKQVCYGRLVPFFLPVPTRLFSTLPSVPTFVYLLCSSGLKPTTSWHRKNTLFSSTVNVPFGDSQSDWPSKVKMKSQFRLIKTIDRFRLFEENFLMPGISFLSVFLKIFFSCTWNFNVFCVDRQNCLAQWLVVGLGASSAAWIAGVVEFWLHSLNRLFQVEFRKIVTFNQKINRILPCRFI